MDLTAGTIAVGTNTRTIVYDRAAERGQGNKVVEKGAQKAGKRTLPLPKPVLHALKAYRATQVAEKLAAGEAYEAAVTCSWTTWGGRGRRTSSGARRTS